jgi:hypothetical protein
LTGALSWLPLAAEALDSRVRIAAVIATALMVGVVLELVRRRRLAERYALLWMFVSIALLILAVWTELLNWIAVDLLHFAVPANFLFVAASAVAFILLLHFSVATSRLAEETKILAQEVARLEAELRTAHSNGAGSDAAAEALDETRSGARVGLGPEEAPHDPPIGGKPASQ